MSKIDFNRVVTTAELQAARLTQVRQDAVQSVAAAVEAAMARRIGQVPLAEMLSWGGKEIAAQAVLSNPAAEPDRLLQAEAAMTGESVAKLAQRIVQNAEAQRASVSVLTGLRRKALAEIAAAEDEVAILAVRVATIDQIGAV